jgi:hypothetical protein
MKPSRVGDSGSNFAVEQTAGSHSLAAAAHRERHRTLPAEMVVAKFKYVGTRRHWRLYCQRRDLRWHEYEALPAARSFERPLDEVDADPTGIFWG